MKIGQKVSLKKYKEFNTTQTHRFFGYTDSMQGLALNGERLEVRDVGGNYGRVALRDESGTIWAFHKDDVIWNMKLENK